MKVYHEIKEMLERELEQIADKRELTSSSLDVMDKVVDIIKDIETICAMREAEEDGYSHFYPYYMYDDGMMDGQSYARGRGRYAKRDSMGRYASEYRGMDGRYSREDSREHMISELDRMEREATDENQKSMIRNWKNQLKTA